MAGVVYLGILSGRDNRFVVWFGIASAIVAPIGLTLFGYALSSGDRDLVQRLAKVPEIERLVEQAKTQEEKVCALEAERARLAEVIRLESRRQAIRDRTESLERDAVRILQELNALDLEAKNADTQIGESPVRDEIAKLRDRVRAREEGDVIIRFGSRIFRVDRDVVKILPFGSGRLLLAYFKIVERYYNTWRKRRGG